MPMHKDFQKILDNFKKQYGSEEGKRRFYAWLNKHKLDDTKPYSVQAQLGECLNGLREAFSWANPLITLYKEDDEAKYYKVKALTANTSMNKNDYRDSIELARAAPTLAWRPLNLNHNHRQMLPFPDNRVDWAAFEDNSVEAIIRISNNLSDIQRQIENGDILHPSIEGEPRTGMMTDEGTAPKWYNFTALALLQREATLPGDPLTYLDPIPLNESMGRSLVESLKEKPSIGEKEKEKNEMTDNIWHEYTGLEEAKWSTAYINTLPNSSFAVVEPCYKDRKDARHLPYKDENGKVDLPHLRNALARMNQIKSVCDGDDSKLRAAAKRRLVAMAKKHLPDSQWAKEELEEGMGNPFIDSCAQCRAFKEYLPETTKTAKVNASEPSDGYVLTAEGGLGPGVGVCKVAGFLVRKNDAACTDGRPRESHTSANDDERISEDLEAMIMKNKNEELEAEAQKNKRQYLDEMTAHTATKGQLAEAQDAIATKDQEIVVRDAKLKRITRQNEDLEKKLDSTLSRLEEMRVKYDHLEKDAEFATDSLERNDKVIESQRNTIATLKQELAEALTKANDESAKRAEAVQRANDAMNRESEVLKDNAILSEKLTTARREVHESSMRATKYAKQTVDLQREVEEERTKYNQLTEDVRDLKKTIGRYKKIKTIRVIT